MLTLKLLALLPASAVAAGPPPPEPEAFVTQIQIPARDAAIDTFAWRDGDSVLISREEAERLGFALPGSAAERVPLNSVPGLSYEDDAAHAAIVIQCQASCFETQIIAPEVEEAPELTISNGAYLNYDAQIQNVDGDTVFAGIGYATMFNSYGRLEASTLMQDRSLTRLETSWVMDREQDMLRVRLGDSAFQRADGAILRFGGVQIGRAFGLRPSLITRPSPSLSGAADSASTVDLYINGMLQSRHEVEAGPFVVEQPTLVDGGGEAQLVVTDLLGRTNVVTRSFFISSTMLRAGYSDWSVAAGAVRNDYGLASTDYGPGFAAGRYRRGVTDALTAEAGVEAGDDGETSGDISFDMLRGRFGLVHVSRAHGGAGGASEIAWQVESPHWSAGLHWAARERGYHRLGDDAASLGEQSMAGSIALDLGDYGALSFTAARISSDISASTAQIAYEPEFSLGALLFRASYAESDNSESAYEIGVSLSITLRDDISADAGVDVSRSGIGSEISMQRTPTPYSGLGWRARAATGEIDRIDAGARYTGAGGESSVHAARVGAVNAIRVGHAGSVGIIEGHPFAGRTVEGGFTLVDVGAPGIEIARNGEVAGVSDRDGRVLITRMQPYERNIVRLDPDDLPSDWAPQQDRIDVALAEGAGAFVSFDARAVRFVNVRARFSDGSLPPRGAVLTRTRDGARFPIGTDGRVVLTGALPGDRASFDMSPLCHANIDGARTDIIITCDAGA